MLRRKTIFSKINFFIEKLIYLYHIFISSNQLASTIIIDKMYQSNRAVS